MSLPLRPTPSCDIASLTRPLWTSAEIVLATGGRALSSFETTAVTIDSRDICGGALFVAIQGPKADGHDYVKMALEAGATGALVSRMPEGLSVDAPLVVVPDVLKALSDLGAFARARSKARFIGVTGSFGKTSTKEALYHVLSHLALTHATERSFNNHWGLPLTLARVHPDHVYAVIEMGMNNLGEIASHTRLTQPHVAVITNTGNAHIGRMGSLDAITEAKGEIFEGLSTGGKGILWAQDASFEAHQQRLKSGDFSYVTFGDPADFRAEGIVTPQGLLVTVSQKNQAVTLTLPTFSRHWARNCAAVAAVLDALGLDWVVALPHLETLTFPQGRGNIVQAPMGIIILDESYNAAPTTMANALQALAEMGQVTKRRTIAILGDMLELAEESMIYHQGLMNVPGFETLAKVYGCGPEMKALMDVLSASQKGAWAATPEEMMSSVLDDARSGDIYLVKGSRGQWAQRGRMAAFVDALQTIKETR